MENIPSTMVLNKHVDGEDTRVCTISVLLVNSSLEKCLGVIRRDSYQAENEDIRWTYETVSELWSYIETIVTILLMGQVMK